MRKIPPVFCATLLFALTDAQGEDLKAARACSRIDDDAARLSCYDAALGRTNAAAVAAKPQPAPPAKAVSAEAVKKFGDNGQFHTEAKPSLPKNLTAQVRQVTQLNAGLYRLILDNGQVWDTTEADSALAFNTNDAVTISRLLLGGYEISLAGHTTSVRATRKQ
jgi:hypothetical protein